MTVDFENNVYVTDGRENSRVEKFDENGNFIKMWGSKGKKDGQFVENHGIVVDESENVYVVDTRNMRIQKFDSTANFIDKWGDLGCNDEQFLIPHDITIDPDGNIYVSDSGNVHFRSNYECN